jgi:hypothetical protein
MMSGVAVMQDVLRLRLQDDDLASDIASDVTTSLRAAGFAIIPIAALSRDRANTKTLPAA